MGPGMKRSLQGEPHNQGTQEKLRGLEKLTTSMPSKNPFGKASNYDGPPGFKRNFASNLQAEPQNQGSQAKLRALEKLLASRPTSSKPSKNPIPGALNNDEQPGLKRSLTSTLQTEPQNQGKRRELETLMESHHSPSVPSRDLFLEASNNDEDSISGRLPNPSLGPSSNILAVNTTTLNQSQGPATPTTPASSTASTTKRVRGKTKGKGLDRIIRNHGKMKIDISEEMGRPLDPEQSAKLSSEIGVIARMMPVPAKWNELSEIEKKAYLDHLEMRFDMDYGAEHVKHWLRVKKRTWKLKKDNLKKLGRSHKT